MQMQPGKKVHRRSHKKSRKGCSQCKQRHLKCDEGQPSCLQCGLAGQHCTYTWPTRPISPVASGRVGRVTASLESSMVCAIPDSSHASTAPSVSSTRESPVEVNTGGHELRVSLHTSTDTGPSDFHVNHVHIRLFHHATTILLPQYGRLYESSHKYIILVQDTSLEYPFLMHQLLAFSALHLSTLDSAQKSMYEVQATGLQSSAIKLFNQSSFKYEGASHVAAFIFSTLLARHVLCTVLLATNDDSGRIIEGLAEFFHVQLGTRTVVGGGWESLLRHPNLTEFLSGFGDRRSSGHDACINCAVLYEMIDASRLNVEARAEYCHVIERLEYCVSCSRKDTHESIFAWPTLLKSNFAEELVERRPEALVILAHFAVLIHWHRHIWWFGRGSRHVIQCIAQHLGPRWEKWLAWPLSQIIDDS